MLEDFSALSIRLKKTRFGGDHDLCHNGRAVLAVLCTRKLREH